jgi:hypothetical protein
MRHVARAAGLTAALAFAAGCSQPSGQALEPVADEPRIRLAVSSGGQRTIDVAGLPAEDVAHLERAVPSSEMGQALLRVHVAREDPWATPGASRRKSSTTQTTSRCSAERRRQRC